MEVGKGIKILNSLVGFITTATIIGTAWYFYKTNIWRPKVSVVKADYDNGVATLNVNGKEKQLLKNQILSVGGDFGVRFNGDVIDKVNRIELYRNLLVYQVLDMKPGTAGV